MTGTRRSAAGTLAALAVLSAVASAAPAHAQPPGFPDASAAKEVPADKYRHPSPDPTDQNDIFFDTVDGVSCLIGETTMCSGELPGLPDQPGCPAVTQADINAPYRFVWMPGPCIAPGYDVLNPGEQVTNSPVNVTCIAEANRLLGCIDTVHFHGFVLQPSGSFVF